MEESKILEIIYEWKKYQLSRELKNRKVLNKIIKNMGKEIIDIIGVRRCGKSSILSLLMKELNLNEELILYVDFEDPVLINDLSLDLLDQIWEVYRIKINPDKKPYLFFDEIQNIPHWEKWIRKMRDLEKAFIFITGSSSKLMSKEIGSALTGRHITHMVFPLSFEEYLDFKGVKFDKTIKEFIEKKFIFRKHFEEYLYEGGFPEIVITGNKELLKQYFEDILYRDIVLRHEIRDVHLLRQIANYCMTNIANQMSYNSIKNYFKISHDKARSYISHLEESFLIFQLRFFAYSVKVQELKTKKNYCIDNGLRNAVSFKFSKDEGKLAENITFLELKRNDKEIYYWQENNEVNFVVKEKDNSLNAINVSYSDNINEREIKGLKEFANNFGNKVANLTILTKNIERVENDINYIPLWKWLLQNKQGNEIG
ncbi:MAG: ATP-binding protein [Promethearchaeota archaeon]